MIKIREIFFTGFLFLIESNYISLIYFFMPIPKKVINFLEKSKVKYEIIKHKTVYTAFDKSKTLKEKTNIIGKTLVLKISSKEMVIVLIPGDKNLDKVKIKKIINLQRRKEDKKIVKKIEFASERLMKNRFKGMKMGTIAPFGNLFKIPTFVNKSLLNKKKIILNSGCHDQSMAIKGNDFEKIIPDLIKGSFVKSRK